MEDIARGCVPAKIWERKVMMLNYHFVPMQRCWLKYTRLHMHSQAFQLNCDSNATPNILKYFMTNHHGKWNCTPLWSSQSKIKLPTWITFQPWKWITRRLYFEWTSSWFFLAGGSRLWAHIFSFGFWCGWVCFRTQWGRGKEYSITNGLIKCPLQSGVSGLVLIQILKLHLSLRHPFSECSQRHLSLLSFSEKWFLSLTPSVLYSYLGLLSSEFAGI